MATDTERACDDELLADRCGGVLEPRDDEPLVIYDCFHVLHAGCADGRDDACPRCHTPRRVRHDDPPEPAGEAGPAPGEEPRQSRRDGDGESPASMTGSACNHASRLGCCACCCSRRAVAELEGRDLEETSAALTETTNVLAAELERAQGRICRLEEMYGKLEEEFIRLRNDKRAREVEDAEEEVEEAAERRKRSGALQGSLTRPHTTELNLAFHGAMEGF